MFQAVDPFRRPHSGPVDVVITWSTTHVNAGSFGKATADPDDSEAASAGGRREPPIPGRRRRRTKEERCKHPFYEQKYSNDEWATTKNAEIYFFDLFF